MESFEAKLRKDTDKILSREHSRVYSKYLKVRISPEVEKRISTQAKKEGITKPQLIRNLIQAALNRKEDEHHPRTHKKSR